MIFPSIKSIIYRDQISFGCSSQTLWSMDHFILLKIIQDSEEILFMFLYLLVFFVLKIKKIDFKYRSINCITH